MANFRTTQDYVNSVLQLAGEVTNGNSAYTSKALEHLDSIQKTIIMGGNEFNVEVDEVWPWAMAKRPMYIELLPAVEGSVILTKGSEAITFTAAPTDDNASNVSLEGWYISPNNNNGTVYKIAQHTAGSTSAELSSNVVSSSGTESYTAFKLEYDLAPSHIVIESNVNDRLYFAETTAKTAITATLTAGTYTPSALATEMQTHLNAGGASTYTVSYDTVTKRFDFNSDGSGGDNVFYLLSELSSQTLNEVRSRSVLPTLGTGLRDITATTTSGSASVIETDNVLGAVARLVQPIKLHVKNSSYADYLEIATLDPITFDREYPLYQTLERDPTHMKVLDHNHEGTMRVQFNTYPKERRMIEIPYVPVPVDLYNNAASFPLIPRTMSKVLEYGAAAWLLFEKEDSKWEAYYKLAGQKLQSMMASNRKTDQRLSRHFGEVIAREDLMPSRRRRLQYGYTAGS
jgi:hypothetical protein